MDSNEWKPAPANQFVADEWVSVDPGDVHVGVTRWKGVEAVWCREMRPDEFVDWLIGACGASELELIVFEVFMLYPGAELGRNQMGSTFGTCELIGVMKHLARRSGIPIVGYQASTHKALYKMKEYRPPQKPLRAWRSYGAGSHCKDSECLGLYHLRRIALKGKGY